MLFKSEYTFHWKERDKNYAFGSLEWFAVSNYRNRLWRQHFNKVKPFLLQILRHFDKKKENKMELYSSFYLFMLNKNFDSLNFEALFILFFF